MAKRLTERRSCAALLALYPLSYAASRIKGCLVHHHYGLYSGNERDGIYHEIRHRSFEHSHPALGHVPQRALLEVVFWPLSQVELMLRRLPAFERARAGWFREAWVKAGKKLDMGKCCVRFRSLDEVPLDVVGEAIRRMPAKRWVGVYMQALASRQARKPVKPAKREAIATRIGKNTSKTSTRGRKKAS
jgi:hypothetical protein